MGLFDKTTLSGKEPCPDYNGPAPCPIDKKTGMHQDYWVLPEEERKAGFVRPVRTKYIHVGMTKPKNLRDLTIEECEQYSKFGYVKYEEYNPPRGAVTGKYWTEKELNRLEGCGGVTTMNIKIAETYARNPKYYGGTFCSHCGEHFPVGEAGEFEWLDGSRVGT